MRHLPLLALLALLALPLPCPAPEEVSVEERVIQEAEAVERDLVRVVEAVRPSSVSILSFSRQGGGFAVAGSGSGVVLKAEGLVLTNEHVVKGADRIEAALMDGRRFQASVESRVAEYDIALLRLKDDQGRAPKGLRPAVLGRSAALREGDWVLATGNPFFLAASGRPVATLGVVSGLSRVSGGEFLYGNAIQHDAEINPGNSGGPLWDLDGRLVGINGKIVSRSLGLGPSSSGVGFAIPIDQVQNFMKQLLAGGGGVGAGDLGVAVETAKDGKGKEAGARILSVRPGSPAATGRGGGLLAGDVIECVTIGFKAFNIRNATEYVNAMSVWPEGTLIDAIQFRRDKRMLILSDFKLGAQPEAREK